MRMNTQSQDAQSHERWDMVATGGAQVENLCYVGHELSEGLPVRREPALLVERSHDGGARAASSERRAGCPQRVSGDGARAAPRPRHAPGALRRGISLLELLAAMAAATVVMGTAMSLVHTSYRFESRSRMARADERTALRLARQFRTDIHESTSAMVSRNAVADAPLVVLFGPTGRIAYRPHPRGLVRTVASPPGSPGREDFVFSRPIAWTASEEGSLVTLSGSSTADGRQPQVAIEVSAAVPPGATSSREQGASP